MVCGCGGPPALWLLWPKSQWDPATGLSINDFENGRIAVCVGGSSQVSLFDSKTLVVRENLGTTLSHVLDCGSTDRGFAYIATEVAGQLPGYYEPYTQEDIGMRFPTGLCGAWDGMVISGYHTPPRSFASTEPGDPKLVYFHRGKARIIAEWTGRMFVTGPDYHSKRESIAYGLTSYDRYAEDGGPTCSIETMDKNGRRADFQIGLRTTLLRVRWGPNGRLFALAREAGPTQLLCVQPNGAVEIVLDDVAWEDFDIVGWTRIVGAQRSGSSARLSEIPLPKQFR